jgi:hypothetical protein
MAGVESRSFDAPDETRTPDKSKVDLVRVGETTAARLTLDPGWTWADCIKPIAGTESCQLHHVGLAHSGTMAIAHDDGTQQEIHAREAYVIAPGHNAWVVGDEPFVGYEFDTQTAETFATT